MLSLNLMAILKLYMTLIIASSKAEENFEIYQ